MEAGFPDYLCRCGRTHVVSADRWRCDCGGPLDLPVTAAVWPPRQETHSMWRHAGSIAGAAELPWPAISLGEGLTPLVAAGPRLRLKVEYASATGSFKDRGAVVLVALAKALGATRVVADSSGNAGTAVAAYAARAGLAAEIFVPGGTSEKKVRQIRGHGAEITLVDGSREDTAAAAAERVERAGLFYASHVHNPYFLEGTKTYALELFEQLGGTVPDTVVVPAGNGTLVLGAYRGFAALLAAGLVERLPRIVAVQAERCAPVAAAFDAGRDEVPAVPPAATLAEGIAIAAPARGGQLLRAVRESGGAVMTVSEQDIVEAHAGLAAQGFWVEPTGAVAYAAARRLEAVGSPLVEGGVVVAPLCGSGLKATPPER
ncbi:pyridoxal-phosphate dependent enzyme [Nonomuraea jabiensis]|uniref:Threonine synthase n=1 Tax=Nonomuraea jabiensis TaxID=882448 RepID=A0A7W9FXN0_9ACTN|nr:pyridoxal-phosphate dependent enzyme [Nonomuraea jabiensis]MBB5773408.1 threonine synthase [Nonomuraea jabiensis]